MGKTLKALYASPEKIISSTACRAKETIALIKAQWCPLQRVEYDKLLYEGSASTILDKIQTFPSEISSVALVFHNPTVTQLASLLGSSSIPSMPTCGVVILSSKNEKWKFLEVGSCTIENFEFPQKS
jgi:phosphohistidine phosphatase